MVLVYSNKHSLYSEICVGDGAYPWNFEKDILKCQDKKLLTSYQKLLQGSFV